MDTDAAIVITGQAEMDLPETVRGTRGALLDPNDDEKRAVLDAHGAGELADHCDAFKTPFELSIAAACKADLGGIDTRAKLLDAYARRAAKTEPVRAALRWLAWQMHLDVRSSMLVPEALRTMQRSGATSSADVAETALRSPLVHLRQGLLTFAHEDLGRFLAADALVVESADADALADAIAQPRHAALRRDALALEPDATRVARVVGSTADTALLLAAVRGEIDVRCARLARARCDAALDLARAGVAPSRLELGADASGDCWRASRPWSDAEWCALSVAGQALHDGLFVERFVSLLEATDSHGAEAIHELIDGGEERAITRYVAATYALAPRERERALGASVVVQGCDHAQHGFGRRSTAPTPGNASAMLQAATGTPRWGVLYVFMSLLRGESAADCDALPDALDAALRAGGYHLQLHALEGAQRAASQIAADARQRTIDVLQSFKTQDLFLSTALVEALAAYGLIHAGRNVADIHEEIRAVKNLPAEIADPREVARGIVSSVWEDERIVGPYWEAISTLPVDERAELMQLAAEGSRADDLGTDMILRELADAGDLSDPEVQATFLRFAREVDPEAWFMPHMGVRTHDQALRVAARFSAASPVVHDGPPERRGWAAVSELVFWIYREAQGAGGASGRRGEMWELLLGELRSHAADVLSQLAWAGDFRQEDIDAHELLLQHHAGEVRTLLLWSLAHRDESRPFCSRDAPD